MYTHFVDRTPCKASRRWTNPHLADWWVSNQMDKHQVEFCKLCRGYHAYRVRPIEEHPDPKMREGKPENVLS
jgi:hypothetical protein